MSKRIRKYFRNNSTYYQIGKFAVRVNKLWNGSEEGNIRFAGGWKYSLGIKASEGIVVLDWILGSTVIQATRAKNHRLSKLTQEQYLRLIRL